MTVGMGSTMQRALLMVLASAALGLAFNGVSPRGIPYRTPPKRVLAPEEAIALAQARELWRAGTVWFLDARSPEDYAAGHVPNALNLPAENFEEHFGRVAAVVTPESAIVAYCGGEECEESLRLKDKLAQVGYLNVKVLPNGWTVWRNAGLTTETSAGRSETPGKAGPTKR